MDSSYSRFKFTPPHNDPLLHPVDDPARDIKQSDVTPGTIPHRGLVLGYRASQQVERGARVAKTPRGKSLLGVHGPLHMSSLKLVGVTAVYITTVTMARAGLPVPTSCASCHI